MLLGMWTYPLVNINIMNTLGMIGYPFILMSFRECYMFVKSIYKNIPFSVLLATLIGIAVWEIPNLWSQDWIYIIPYINLELFRLNVVVLVGWFALILGPVWIYDFLDKGLNKCKVIGL